MGGIFPRSQLKFDRMKVVVVVALLVDQELVEVHRRFLFNINELVQKILTPLKSLITSDATEASCEAACKVGIAALVHLPFVDLACGPACKELQHLGEIAG